MTLCRHTGCPYDAVHGGLDCVPHFGTVPRHDPGNQFAYHGAYSRTFTLGPADITPGEPAPARPYTLTREPRETVEYGEPIYTGQRGFLARAIERLFG